MGSLFLCLEKSFLMMQIDPFGLVCCCLTFIEFFNIIWQACISRSLMFFILPFMLLLLRYESDYEEYGTGKVSV
jgi:hypothetical protein